MIDIMILVVELYRNLCSGLTYAVEKIKTIKDDKIIRKIIQIHLLLEDIIDSAKKQIETIKNLKPSEDMDHIRDLLITQRYKLINLSESLHDNVSEQIYKLFKPETRRKIHSIITIKEGALYEVIFRMDYLFSRREPMIREKIFKKIEEQERILSELEECSVKMSDFITNNLNVKDVLRFI